MKVPTLTLLLLLLILDFGAAEPLRKSRRDLTVGIIKPNFTDISNYNYTVAINFAESSKTFKLLGGGAIINEQWVLTAAYNVKGFNAKDLRVRVNSNFPTSKGKAYQVQKVVTHEDYSANWTYDLSLLMLKKAIKIKVTPVKLATTSFLNTGIGTVTGYGSQGSKLSDLSDSSLQFANINLYDYKTCDQDWYGTELSEGEICGYSPGVGPCHADFGDPVTQCDDSGSCTLLGIFSGSYGCADDHFPGIYMDIGYFNDWITSTIK